MKKLITLIGLIGILVVIPKDPGFAQVKWTFGGNMGLAIGSGAGNTSAGFNFGPMAEAVFSKRFAVGTEFNINTTTGTPIEWADYFKMYFPIPGSAIKPYADMGFSLFFVTGGPYFSIRFGGGAQFPITKNLSIPADLQLGPIFVTGVTVFGILIRTGIRYEM